MNKFFLTLAATLAFTGGAAGQNIKGHYVSKTEGDGTIYHTLPSTLFENREEGELTFDITYKSNSNQMAAINFTYVMQNITPADSICFTCGVTRMKGVVSKLYISPLKRQWKHRYTFTTGVKALYLFFDESAEPNITIYAKGRSYLYKVKPSAWRSYAPVASKIFEMIRINE